MSDQSSSSRESLTSQVIDRATRDPGFRQELLGDPSKALKQELGLQLPDSIEIRVVEETPSTLYLVLPPQPIATGQELTDRELEQVAGGWSVDSGGCGTCARPVESDMGGCAYCQ